MNITSNSTPKDIPRQRWLRIIPPILITCIISYMDRVNIAFAMPGGMDADLGKVRISRSFLPKLTR